MKWPAGKQLEKSKVKAGQTVPAGIGGYQRGVREFAEHCGCMRLGGAANFPDLLEGDHAPAQWTTWGAAMISLMNRLENADARSVFAHARLRPHGVRIGLAAPGI
jgi:hypothetical protein